MRNQPCCTTGLSAARSGAEGREVGEVVYREEEWKRTAGTPGQLARIRWEYQPAVIRDTNPNGKDVKSPPTAHLGFRLASHSGSRKRGARAIVRNRGAGLVNPDSSQRRRLASYHSLRTAPKSVL
jgi:hypothetical protein